MRRLVCSVISVVLATGALSARADCTGGDCLPGGGPEETDCVAEFKGVELNYPFFKPSVMVQEPKTDRRCFDGEAGCDLDGVTNGVCVFAVDLCIAATDPALPSCTAGTVSKARLKAKKADAKALQRAVKGLGPASDVTCTTGGQVAVKLKKSNKKGRRSVVKVSAKGDAGKDKDTLELLCLPRQWPSHNFDDQGTNATPHESKITPAKVKKLKMKWAVSLGAVTSTPTFGNGLLYVTSWDGFLYALDPKTGDEVWSFNAGGAGGVQSSAALTADGRVLIADGNVDVHCLDAVTGAPLWERNLGVPPIDHIWPSAAIANGRVFIGVGALLDDPATPGVLYALDLDTGEVLWSFKTVPDNICTTDTRTECTTNGDCPFGGECIPGLGGAVTATVALDPTGEQVYMNTVGSFTYPSIGDSDSIFRFDAATGDLLWKNRVTPDEQFGTCDGDTAIDCGTGSACGAFGPCTTKAFYHDFGFLNGPMFVPGADGNPLVVSGSKDGSLYAFDPETGGITWRREILPVPISPFFAGWGLFNGAIGFADGRIHGALYGHGNPGTMPANHLQAFDVADGSVVWEDDIGNSWGDVAIGGGVVYAGTQVSTDFYAYDAATGERLRAFTMPENVAGGAAIVNGWLYIPYGVFGGGGVQAWAVK